MRWIDFENKKPTDAFPGWEPWGEDDWTQWLQKSEELLKKMEQCNDEAEQKGADGDAAGAQECTAARNDVITKNGAHWGKLKPWLLMAMVLYQFKTPTKAQTTSL